MTCGIVVLNYNDADTTIQLVEAIRDFTSIDHIVVVDNCSTDNSYTRLERLHSSKIDIVKSESNKGYAAGNNIGAKILVEDYGVDIIGIANPDVEFSNKFVEKIKNDFSVNLKYSIISGLQLNKIGKIANHPFWKLYNVKEYFYLRLNDLFIIRRILKNDVINKYISDKLSENGDIVTVGVVEGSLFFIKASVFKDIGYFDEGTFLYCEEDILAKRLYKIGKNVGVDLGITYVHYGEHTTQKNLTNKAKIDCSYNSYIHYFNNYLSSNRLVQILNLILCNLIRFEGYLRVNIKNVMRK